NPIAGRLGRIGAVELERMTLVAEGMLAIQAGSAPHLLQERLEALSTVAPKAAKKKVQSAEDSP
ncbi:motility protein A, partial [Pseudomonas sp. BGM005]|nr:motility protein A [Pseudomonas sp. BG5]